MHWPRIFLPATSGKPSRRWRARISDLSEFWFVGGVDRDVYAKAKKDSTIGALPTNHSPYFAPVLQPTLEKGVETLVVSALAWLGQ
jgi:hypothetical protein